MNSKINTIPIENILFWDLEVVRKQEILDVNTPDFKLFQLKNRNKDTDKLPSEDETIELYNRKAGLSPTHNKIVCLSMAVVKNGVINVKSITGHQADIITEFSKVLESGLIPCGWNIIKFDFPVLRIKAFEEGIINYAPEKFNDAGKKEWAMSEEKYKVNMIDLMLQYQGTHYVPSSLAEACHILNVPTPKDDIDGSQVSDIYYKEGVERIKKYCEKDVVACVHILQRMRGDELITKIKVKDESPKDDRNVLVKLAEENYLSDSIKKELFQLFKVKKLLKKDVAQMTDIIESAYIKSDFSTEDSTATDDDETVNYKKIEIQQLFDEYFKK